MICEIFVFNGLAGGYNDKLLVPGTENHFFNESR
jgi:hypothetical protein